MDAYPSLLVTPLFIRSGVYGAKTHWVSISDATPASPLRQKPSHRSPTGAIRRGGEVGMHTPPLGSAWHGRQHHPGMPCLATRPPRPPPPQSPNFLSIARALTIPTIMMPTYLPPPAHDPCPIVRISKPSVRVIPTAETSVDPLGLAWHGRQHHPGMPCLLATRPPRYPPPQSPYFLSLARALTVPTMKPTYLPPPAQDQCPIVSISKLSVRVIPTAETSVDCYNDGLFT